MHFDLAGSFQGKAPFLGSAHHLQPPILIQVPFQGLPTILPPDTREWLFQEIAYINAIFFAEIIRMIFIYILDTQ